MPSWYEAVFQIGDDYFHVPYLVDKAEVDMLVRSLPPSARTRFVHEGRTVGRNELLALAAAADLAHTLAGLPADYRHHGVVERWPVHRNQPGILLGDDGRRWYADAHNTVGRRRIDPGSRVIFHGDGVIADRRKYPTARTITVDAQPDRELPHDA